MARTRQIKPGFFVNEDMVELPFHTRLLFIGLLTIADRRGVLEDRPKKIKMAIFPADNIDIDASLNELAEFKFIIRYQVDGGKYIHICEFVKHQNPHKDEKANDMPMPTQGVNDARNMQAPYEQGGGTVQAPYEQGGNPACTFQSCTFQSSTFQEHMSAEAVLDEKPIEKVTVEEKKPKPKKTEYTQEFERAFSSYPERNGDNPKNKAFGSWKARLREGANAEEMLAGINRYKKYCDDTSATGTAYVKHMATFLGTDRFYKNEWKQKSPGDCAGQDQGLIKKRGNYGRKLSLVDQAQLACERLEERERYEQEQAVCAIAQ
jgi:hypothetical protein